MSEHLLTLTSAIEALEDNSFHAMCENWEGFEDHRAELNFILDWVEKYLVVKRDGV